MRVLFCTFPGARSHLYTMTPLAWALRTAGHQVLVAGSPDLVHAASTTGLPFAEVGEAPGGRISRAAKVTAGRDSALATPPTHQEAYAEWDPAGTLDALVDGVVGPLNETAVDDTVALVRAWQPDLVIWDQMCPVGAIAAAATGTPHARFLYATDAIEQLRQAASRRGEPDALVAWMTDEAQRRGLVLDRDAPTGQLSIDTLPDWTWHPSPWFRRAPLRHLAFNGPSTVPAWVHREPELPRVCLTLGVSHREIGVEEASAATFLDAVDGLPAEIIATFTADQVGGLDVPPNVQLHDFVPLGALLPTCSVLVHHGGAGAFSGGLEHGVPQLIVPGSAVRWFGGVAVAEGLATRSAGRLVADARR